MKYIYKILFNILGLFGYKVVGINKESFPFDINGHMTHVKCGHQWKIMKIEDSAMINVNGKLISKPYDKEDRKRNWVLPIPRDNK